ncbi:TniQ family protein [Rhizobium ruizarguesonis]
MSGLFPVPLLEGEPVTSILSRLARANGAPNSRAFCRDAGIDYRGLNRGDDVAVDRLATVSGMPLDELRKRAIVATQNSGAMTGDCVYPVRMLRRSKLRFCPHCVLEDDLNETLMPSARRYVRLHWMFPQAATCPVHSAVVIEVEDERITNFPFDFISQVEIVADRMEEFVEASTRRTPTSFEHYVLERLSAIKQHGPLLDKMNLAVGISVCELFGVADVFGRNVAAASLSDQELIASREAGYRAFLAGDGGIGKLLDRIRATHHTNKAGGLVMYGKLYTALAGGYQAPEYDSVRELVRKHTLTSTAVINGADFFGTVTNSPWTTITAISRATGIHDKTIRRRLADLGHIDLLQASNRGFYVAVSAAEEVIALVNDVVTLDEAATLLGTKPSTMKILVADGLIEPALKRRWVDDGDYESRNWFSRSTLMGIRESILSRASTSFPDDWRDLFDVSRMVGLRFVDIIALVTEGRLKNIGCVSGEEGFAGLRLDCAEVEKFLENSKPAYVGRIEICKRLFLKAEAFAFLIGTDALPAERRQIRSGRVPVWTMREEDLDAFDARYATYARLTQETGIGARGIGRRMRENGVNPAFPVETVKQPIVERRHLIGWTWADE